MEYVPYFPLKTLSPISGQTLPVVVDSRFITFSHAPLVDRQLYGCTHYSLDSDIAALVMHTGVLFLDPRTKDSRHRQFCRTSNLYEVMGLPDKDYVRQAVVVEIPQDVVIKGVLVVLLFSNSPPAFRASNRNGVRSRDAPLDVCAMRIASFRILTRFDEVRPLVRPFKVGRKSTVAPDFCLSCMGELAIRYSRDFIVQLFSLANIFAGLFSVYHIFFDVHRERYEIVMEDTDTDIGVQFQVEQLLEPVSLEMLKRRSSYVPQAKPIGDPVPYWAISPGVDSLAFGDNVFSPVSHISLLTISGRIKAK
jgi:hypothetical protein